MAKSVKDHREDTRGGEEASWVTGCASRLPAPCQTLHRMRGPDPDNNNSAVKVYFQLGGLRSVREEAILSLLAHLLKEPCFNTLRTKEQLGCVGAPPSRSYTAVFAHTTPSRSFLVASPPLAFQLHRVERYGEDMWGFRVVDYSAVQGLWARLP
jgi:secreted Zn-dependent insulinase-like peptidase